MILNIVLGYLLVSGLVVLGIVIAALCTRRGPKAGPLRCSTVFDDDTQCVYRADHDWGCDTFDGARKVRS